MKRVLLLTAVVLGLSWANAAETPTPPAGGPTIEHIPVTTVLRGQPAHVVANVRAAPGSLLTQVRVLTRATDIGTPIPYSMTGGPGDGAYASEVPWSAISGLPRFWYHVEVRDSLGRVSSTKWFPVKIIDAPAEEGAAKSALLSSKGFTIAGGALLIGGAVAVGEHNDWFKKGTSSTRSTESNTPPSTLVTRKDPPRNDKPKNDPPVTPPHVKPPPVVDPCAPGAPAPDVSLDPTTMDPFNYLSPILAKVCGACSSTTIRVTTSWGFNASSSVTDLTGCKGGALFSIVKPISGVANANSELIEFYDGARLIYSTRWPDPSFFTAGAPAVP